jgi:hypothetical protein
MCLLFKRKKKNVCLVAPSPDWREKSRIDEVGGNKKKNAQRSQKYFVGCVISIDFETQHTIDSFIIGGTKREIKNKKRTKNTV